MTIKGMLDRGARRVLVTCQDNGIGIPAQDLADLFTRFFRASNATDQAIPGAGLGLSITKQIVEAHRGELRLTSVEEGGTTSGDRGHGSADVSFAPCGQYQFAARELCPRLAGAARPVVDPAQTPLDLHDSVAVLVLPEAAFEHGQFAQA